jgi:ferredoxin-NADP reductase
MLETSLSAVLGLVYIAIGAIIVWLIFHASSRLKDKGASARLVQGHRIGGYIFILLFCVMTYYMILKIKDSPDELALRPMIHMLLAMLLTPLIFIKVLVARYYKTYYSVLMPLGLIIFTLSFVIVMMTVGPYFLRRATIKDVALDSINLGTNKIDVDAARILTEKKCSKCHGLDRVVGVQKDARGWLASVNRMRALPGSAITESDVPTIVSYLVSQATVVDDKGQMTAEGLKDAGKGLVDNRCNKCHDLDRTYSAKKSADEWRSTVVRMVAYAQGNGLFKTGEDEEIIKFLAQTQTPEAAQQRTEMVAKASNGGTSLLGSEVKAPAIPKPISPLNGSAIVVVFGGIIIFGVMMLRRPGNLPLGIALASAGGVPKEPTNSTPVKSAVKGPQPVAPDPKKSSLVLQLARIETQTSNAKTLRFLIPSGEQFSARPGQFSTFQWMIDGKKVVRSYTICSSPTQTGYIEITPKQVDNGYVSTFLNEKAAIGLTVEAKGPSGQFYFDETKHRKLVMLAAGSGITPMVSILRYLDDRCLETDATLIYNVQTSKDIIFEKELKRLKECLNNFRYNISLTKPDKDWRGTTGRINRALIEANVKDLKGSTFFLCGPKQFMDSLSETLSSMGIAADQIKVESFGGRPLLEKASSDSASETKPSESTIAQEKVEKRNVTKPLVVSDNSVEFVRSRKQCLVPADKTLLEVAEINAVTIPFSCRQGQCGTCTTRLLEGEVFMEAEDGLDPELKEEGYILTCVGYAKGKVKLDA